MNTLKELLLVAVAAALALMVVTITSALIRMDRAQEPVPEIYDNDTELNWAYRIVRCVQGYKDDSEHQ